MELKLNGDQFGLEPPFPFNVLLQENGIEDGALFVHGFIEGFSFLGAIVTWIITEVIAPDRAPFIMADVVNFLFDVSGLSAHPEHTNDLTLQMRDRQAIQESKTPMVN